VPADKYRFRVLGGTDVPDAPLDLGRHIVAQCAQGPVEFRARLETVRPDVVARLATQINPESADVCTCSLLSHAREVPVAGHEEGVSQLFIEQRGVPGLLQQWVSVYYRKARIGCTSLHTRVSRKDPLSAGVFSARLRACQDAGIIPPEAGVEAAVATLMAADISSRHPLRVELGLESLLVQSCHERSHELLITLELPSCEPAPRLVLADIWQPGSPIALRRYGTPDAALRAPSVETYAIHTRLDGPLTDAMVAIWSPKDQLSVEWEVDDELGLCGVTVASNAEASSGAAHALTVELDVKGHVDFTYGPDPESLGERISERARIDLEYMYAP
jgi:hypothetical protein